MDEKPKGKRNVRHELEDDVVYKGLSNKKDVTCPTTGELISEREYLRRFNAEWYYGTRQKKNGYQVITTKEGQQEAERNNNNNKRDALATAVRRGQLEELRPEHQDFMEHASNEWEWQDVYKIAGPEQAKHVIFEQAKRDIEDGVIDLDVILSRFVIKMMKLKTLNERKRKQKGKQ